MDISSWSFSVSCSKMSLSAMPNTRQAPTYSLFSPPCAHNNRVGSPATSAGPC